MSDEFAEMADKLEGEQVNSCGCDTCTMLRKAASMMRKVVDAKPALQLDEQCVLTSNECKYAEDVCMPEFRCAVRCQYALAAEQKAELLRLLDKVPVMSAYAVDRLRDVRKYLEAIGGQ